jgi:hypothetical protein
LTGGFVQARLEPTATRDLRVIVDGTEVGTVPAPNTTGAATACGKIQRPRRSSPPSLMVRLPEPADGTDDS